MCDYYTCTKGIIAIEIKEGEIVTSGITIDLHKYYKKLFTDKLNLLKSDFDIDIAIPKNNTAVSLYVTKYIHPIDNYDLLVQKTSTTRFKEGKEQFARLCYYSRNIHLNDFVEVIELLEKNDLELEFSYEFVDERLEELTLFLLTFKKEVLIEFYSILLKVLCSNTYYELYRRGKVFYFGHKTDIYSIVGSILKMLRWNTYLGEEVEKYLQESH